ncbi:MAG: efflux RND transporter periplasmic adaptor subunit [Bacteroidota bacterium]
MKTAVKYLLGAIVIGVFGYTIYFLYQKSKPKVETYRTEKAFVSDIVKKTVATGTIKPEEEIEIKPQVSGIISKIFVEEGDIVKQGDMIAEIKIIPDMANLNNAESRVETTKLTLENAKRDFDRNNELYNSKVISESDFQIIENNYKKALRDYEAAQNNLDIVKKGSAKKFSKTSNTLIKATVNGMVLSIPVKKGYQVIQSNNFNAGTTIAFIADMGKMIFEGKVDESEVGKIKNGMSLILTIGAIEDVEFAAELKRIAPKGEEENGAVQFLIEADVKLKEDYFIRSGYSANASIVLDKRDSVLVIKESLLQFDKEKTPYVEIALGDGQFERKDVEIGLSDGINVEILNGVTESDSLKVWDKPI